MIVEGEINVLVQQILISIERVMLFMFLFWNDCEIQVKCFNDLKCQTNKKPTKIPLHQILPARQLRHTGQLNLTSARLMELLHAHN